MKFRDIFEWYDVERRDISKEDDGEVIGSGVFADVHDNAKDDHMVNKRLKNTDDPDPYDEYVEFLVNTKVWQSNPHFPRIYITSGTGDYTMEKLVPYKDIEIDMLKAFWDANFEGKPPYNDTPATDEKLELRAKYEIAKHIASRMHNDKHRETIIQPQLKEAVRIVVDLCDEMGFRLDIHADNFMFRRLPHGIQLVITDPFALM